MQTDSGAAIKALRRELGISQAELARTAGVNLSSLFRFEQRDEPRPGTYLRYLFALRQAAKEQAGAKSEVAAELAKVAGEMASEASELASAVKVEHYI